ncbi:MULTISPECIES: arylsulfatase [unclassified Duganella]|uniref:arylsulfatase n=1 Tax=unclassified Duganella TaxID=2636909 RepID=UPI000E344091|nr:MULTISPECIES: arylsulfatase [unclassified Duganella]RFP13658.1 arylsulfatase [Duganella sp. BJB475]RFP36366.1 arylsulfatase [Duganella sp. BJB476]
MGKLETVLRRSALLGATALALACPQAAAEARPERRPNIVVLVADDWGYSDVGAFGGEIATPQIDSLARRGMRFANFHVAASCSPTRAMLLTGVDNHRNGVGNMPEAMPAVHEGKPGYGGVLNDRVVTLATLLRDGGYHTYIAGKWHLGKTASTLPGRRGFERSYIQADSGSDNWEEKPYIFLYDKASWFEQDQPVHLPAGYYSSTLIVDQIIGNIRVGRQDGQPFFAYLGFQANHIPVQAPQALIDKYRGAYDAGWTALRQARRQRAIELGLIPAGAGMVTMASTADWNALSAQQKTYEARRMEVYAAMAEAMDQQIGRLIAELKRTGEYDNTVFVFLSDNGAEPTDPYDIPAVRLWMSMHYSRDIDRLGGKGAMSSLGPSWASAAAAPLSTYKFFAGEGGLRTPLIIAGVPGTQGDRVSTTLTHVTDIVPTLLEVAGVAAPAGSYRGQPVEALQGSSLVPVLQGRAVRAHGEEQAIGYELSGNAALFKGDYKLLKNMPPVGDSQWHLYDIASDPGEVRDLRDSEPQRFAAMQRDYAEYARKNGVLPMPEGYDYKVQGQLYALKHVLLPELLAALPWALAGLLLLVAVLVVRRRQRA